MKILVINTGSSSLKYQLFFMDTSEVLAGGLIEKIGETSSHISHKKFPSRPDGIKVDKEQKVSGHKEAIAIMIDLLTDKETGVIESKQDITAIGHRVVHGGEAFHEPVIIDEKVVSAIQEHAPLAPLHNPANLIGIEACRDSFSGIPQVAVFDTAFHQSIPSHAFHYAIEHELYEKYKIRRYGFHGTSHKFVAFRTAEFLNTSLDKLNLITIHLGNGSSITAIQNGKSVDTSMGMTPLEGIVMGTRSGDIDPGILFFLANELKMDIAGLDALLNKKSGLKGLCGTNDMRDVLEKRKGGDPKAKLAFDLYVYRIKKYIGAYYAALGRLDSIVFTGGIGENSSEIRQGCLQGLENLGIILSDEKNTINNGESREINATESKVKVLVVPTNEELQIAKGTMGLIS